jgi:hypothetical protein
MCARIISIAILVVATTWVTVAGLSTGNAQTTEKQKNIVPVVFDPTAMAQTIKELKKPTDVEFVAVPLKDVLHLFTERQDLKFKIETSERTPVTIKATGRLGHVLVQLLATVKCEYAILPNGVIVVRESLKMPIDKHGKTGRP